MADAVADVGVDAVAGLAAEATLGVAGVGVAGVGVADSGVAEPVPPSVPLLVLGSASPARASLLRHAGIRPAVLTSEVDEDALVAGFGPQAADPHWLTQELARAKALDVAARVGAGALAGAGTDPGRRVLVIGADSMLSFDGEVLGKALIGLSLPALRQLLGSLGIRWTDLWNCV